MGASLFERLLGSVFRWVNRRIVWHRLPYPIALANLAALRINLRWHNLYDTERNPRTPPDPGDFDVRRNRTPDGSYNDLANPAMGMIETRFGRNVPISETFGETGETLVTPNPRLISKKLMTRDEFVPAAILNVLVPAWLQFMVHDWMTHGSNDKSLEPLKIPLEPDDDWHENPMTVIRTRADPTRSEKDEGYPATFLNHETQWWDGSQIYGSSAERLKLVRSNPKTKRLVPDGKLYLERNGHLPLDEHGVELAGVNGNWWIGLSTLHTLFAREHNAICDLLKLEHPDKDGEWYFQKARLINAALMAKIHTVEWTPALLDTPELRTGMRSNWWGLLDEWYYRAFGRASDSELLSGIMGSPADHHAAPYALTEEFTAVYRMHPLIPDDFDFRKLADDSPILKATLPEVGGSNAHKIYDKVSLEDAIYSLGTSHPGALVLHNFPKHLQKLEKQVTGRVVDLAAVDIIRDRERGVPRYCQFRKHLEMSVPTTFEELTGDPKTARELEEIYGDVEKVDLLVGTLAEKDPPGFAFSDTAFRIFILMASRRLKSDRFFTDDYTPEVYTDAGMRWIDDNTMRSVLLRHFPALEPRMAPVRNVFFPWSRD